MAKKGKGSVAQPWLTEEDKAHQLIARVKILRSLQECGSDLTLLILRGHLQVEQLLYDLVKTAVWHPGVIDRMRLTFATAVDLAEALVMSDAEELWSTLRKLNGLRNTIAHDVHPDGLEDQIRKFVPKELDHVERAVYIHADSELVGEYIGAIYWIIRRLTVMAQVTLMQKHRLQGILKGTPDPLKEPGVFEA